MEELFLSKEVLQEGKELLLFLSELDPEKSREFKGFIQGARFAMRKDLPTGFLKGIAPSPPSSPSKQAYAKPRSAMPGQMELIF